METTLKTLDSINKYFDILSKTGYVNYSVVDKLLVMSFVDALLTSPLAEFISEEDRGIILKKIEYLYRECLISHL